MERLVKGCLDSPGFWKNVKLFCDDGVLFNKPKVKKHLLVYSDEGVYLGSAGDGWAPVFLALTKWLECSHQTVVFIHESASYREDDFHEMNHEKLAQMGMFICANGRLFVLREDAEQDKEPTYEILAGLEFLRVSSREALEIIQGGSFKR